MTKTLTEQWRDKELKDGDYYVLNKAGDIVCDYYIEILGHFDSVLTENVKEVLASVPTYAEFMDLMSNLEYIDKYRELLSKTDKLEKKLEIATKALEEICDGYSEETCCGERARKALKEMEGVK